MKKPESEQTLIADITEDRISVPKIRATQKNIY